MLVPLEVHGWVKITLDSEVIYEGSNTVTDYVLEYIRDSLIDVGSFNPISYLVLTYAGTSTTQKAPNITEIGTNGFSALAIWSVSDGTFNNITRMALENSVDELCFATVPAFTKTATQNLSVEWTVTIT